MTEDALVACPTTGQTVERVLQPFTPRYTGSGFYATIVGPASELTAIRATGAAPAGAE